ncbi:hypothetical protein GPAL_0153 [Glaciecola pallidula DSM 14239 = ACAM 615]|uniref:Uncharacterized protein n=1 Tax=Brumicola pallidula DSM 14239 = ACAM 615 TaxID=1121922 RepID=K6Y2H6_9ALTE|nr:hypothetical protein GPAL_0153 [Glaciecola pallidula DSM 14239 = ACAM 615]
MNENKMERSFMKPRLVHFEVLIASNVDVTFNNRCVSY